RTGIALRTSRQEGMALLRLGSRRTARSGHVHPHPDLPAQRHRSSSLACRYPRPHRRASGKPPRRTASLALGKARHRARRLIMQLNKIHSVRILALVARELGEDEDWLSALATEMEPED